MTNEELEKKAEETVKRNVCGDCEQCDVHGYIGCDTYKYSRDSFIAGAKEMQKENAISERIIIGEQMEIDRLEKENRELKLLNEKMEDWINRIKKLKEENEQLKAQIEQMKNCLNCKFGDLGEDDIWCYNRERHGFYDAKKGCEHWEVKE